MSKISMNEGIQNTLISEEELKSQLDPQKYRAYIPSPFIITGLPTREPQKLPFTRQYNNISLTLSGVNHVPYGKYGRLLLTILTTHAVLSKNNTDVDKVVIEYNSLSQLLKELQLPKTRGKDIRDQLSYFVKAAFIFEEKETKKIDKSIIKDLFDEPVDLDDEVKATAVSTGMIPFLSELKYIDIENRSAKETVALSITLSAEFTRYSREHSVPIDYTIYKEISSPIGKDLYAWMVYRNNSISEKPLFVPYKLLVEQFMPVAEGSVRTQERTNFDYLKDQIRAVQKLCPELKVTFDKDGSGITLHKSNLPKLTDEEHYVLVTSTL